ncbi:flavin reductase family protein [soil metagenome]
MTRDIHPDDFRDALGMFTTGVTVVAAVLDDLLHGMTANAVTSVSLEPPLILVCVDRKAGMHDLIPQAGGFAVTVLGAEQEAESVWFASPRRPHGRDQFDGIDWHPAPASGAPVLDTGVAFLDCRLADAFDGGDHSIFVGEVVDLGRLGGREPLVWFDGVYRTLAPDA